MFNKIPHFSLFILCLLLIIGGLFRFYNLNWGAPYYFHPDERNIASTISQLSFPNEMNPHFFAYGSLPIYVVYFVGIICNIIQSIVHPKDIFSVTFEQALLIGRFFSAFFSIALIPLLYMVGKKIYGKTTGLFAAFFATTSIGFIQYAHFSTFEMWLTLFTTVLFYFCILFPGKNRKRSLIALGITFGILCGIKISSIILLIPILFLFSHTAFYIHAHFFSRVKLFFLSCISFSLIACVIFFLTNPYVVITPLEFLSSMNYESSVVLHTLPVFYTQGFINTMPIFYQTFSIFPFLINPFLLLLFIPSCGFIVYKMRQKQSLPFGMLILFFLILLFSQAFFFAKWTRYMIPTLPFVYLIIAVFLSDFKKLSIYVSTVFLCSVVIICNLYAFAFVYLVYYQQDSRHAAALWATKNIAHTEPILSEVYDLGIVPFNHQFPNITLFNFYDIETNSVEEERLKQLQKNTSIIILPSQRIVKTRLKNSHVFPMGYSFYNSLSQERGYKKIYQTPCDMICKIIYLGDPIFSVEETINVFDRPIVSIYKKI